MGKAAKGRSSRSQTSRFSEPEIIQMDQLLLEGKDNLLDENFHRKIADKFNRSSGRAGRSAIQVKQVQRWFHSRQNVRSAEAASSPIASKEVAIVPKTSLSHNVSGSSSIMLIGALLDMGEMIPEVMELEFEARSSDGAWYDVAAFVAHRVLSSGIPEVRVRFQGFCAEDDEWVNVKEAVRERSVPLESSECWKVEVGDLVLCFREASDQDAYFDARVLEIQKKMHDMRGCRCLFLVQYDHDQIEERVQLGRLCRRPSY